MQAEEVERNNITYSCAINGFFVVHTGYMHRMAFSEDASLEFLFYQPPTRGVLTCGVNDGVPKNKRFILEGNLRKDHGT